MAAVVYDSLLLLAVLFLATLVALPFNAGQAFSSKQFLFPVYLLFISFIFFGWFWTHGGQTLGLRSWKMTVVSLKNHPVSWRQSFLRFIGAIISWSCLGLGYLWCIVDKHHMCWHDHLSGTRIIRYSR